MSGLRGLASEQKAALDWVVFCEGKGLSCWLGLIAEKHKKIGITA
jgi:hypothetical protein